MRLIKFTPSIKDTTERQQLWCSYCMNAFDPCHLSCFFFFVLPLQAASVIAAAGLTARVHLSLSCEGLANLDVGSMSDPFVVSASRVCTASPASNERIFFLVQICEFQNWQTTVLAACVETLADCCCASGDTWACFCMIVCVGAFTSGLALFVGNNNKYAYYEVSYYRGTVVLFFFGSIIVFCTQKKKRRKNPAKAIYIYYIYIRSISFSKKLFSCIWQLFCFLFCSGSFCFGFGWFGCVWQLFCLLYWKSKNSMFGPKNYHINIIPTSMILKNTLVVKFLARNIGGVDEVRRRIGLERDRANRGGGQQPQPEVRDPRASGEIGVLSWLWLC